MTNEQLRTFETLTGQQYDLNGELLKVPRSLRQIYHLGYDMSYRNIMSCGEISRGDNKFIDNVIQIAARVIRYKDNWYDRFEAREEDRFHWELNLETLRSDGMPEQHIFLTEVLEDMASLRIDFVFNKSQGVHTVVHEFNYGEQTQWTVSEFNAYLAAVISQQRERELEAELDRSSRIKSVYVPPTGKLNKLQEMLHNMHIAGQAEL